MKWDQGLLTLFLTAGVTALTAAACGPSNTLVPVLPLPHKLKQMNQCATSIGNRETKVVGRGAAVKAGETATISTMPICKQVQDDSGKSSYRWSTEEFGYKLGADSQGRMSVQVAIEVLIDGKTTEEARVVVDKIQALCKPLIEAQWQGRQLGSSLAISLDAVVKDGSFQSRNQSKTSHILNMSGNDNQGYVINFWSDRARFNPKVENDPGYNECLAKHANDPNKEFNCSGDIYAKVDAANTPFCAEMAVLVGHYLGLPQGADQACGTEESSPGPKGSNPSQNFMKAAGRSANVGENFFKNVKFSDSDRDLVIERGCQVESTKTAAPTPAPSATPQQGFQPRRRTAPVQSAAQTVLTTSGSGNVSGTAGLAGK